jgi:hypothetical protein
MIAQSDTPSVELPCYTTPPSVLLYCKIFSPPVYLFDLGVCYLMSHVSAATLLAARAATLYFGCGPRSCFVLLTEFSPLPAPLLYIGTGPTPRCRNNFKTSHPFLSYLLLPLPSTSIVAPLLLLGIYHNRCSLPSLRPIAHVSPSRHSILDENVQTR